MDKIVLTPEQEASVLNAWNTAPKGTAAALKDLVRAAFGEGFDGRSEQGKAVKEFLASKNLKAKAAQEYTPKSTYIILSDSHKEYIKNNFDKEQSPLEMAKVIFNNSHLVELSAECRMVKAYIATFASPSDDGNLKAYRPPKTPEAAINKINEYSFNAIDKEKLLPNQPTNFKALIKFLHTYRFVLTINGYSKEEERQLFESSFIRFTHDKPDLTEEEVDLYINVCIDIVNYTRMQGEVNNLSLIRDQVTEDSDGKIAMSIVEAITSLYGEMDNNFKRQGKSLETLNGKRNDRMKNRVKENASIISLVEAWKNEEQRKKMIKLAEVERKKLECEVDRTGSLEAVKASIWGVSKEEIVDGEL